MASRIGFLCGKTRGRALERSVALAGRADILFALAKTVGWHSAGRILARRILRRHAIASITIDSQRLEIRPTDSDLFVVAQVFGLEEYGVEEDVADALNERARREFGQGRVPLIIDAGANIGLSSIYFAKRYPFARIIAVEPDRHTFEIMRRNCRGIDQIEPVHGALWKHNKGVNLTNLNGTAWARTVADHGDTPSFTIETLLKSVDGGYPFILKLDIEGAEREVIGSSPDCVRAFHCIMIEPHDFLHPGAGSIAPLYSALAGKKVDTVIRGENLLIFDSTLVRRGPDVPPNAQ